MRPGRKNGIKPDGWKIELELGNKQDLLEIGRQKKVQDGKDSRAIQLGVLSLNDKTQDPPHNTQKIIAESLGMSTGKAKLGGDHKSEKYKSSLSKNDKVDPPHNTQKIIAESLGKSTGKAKREANLLIGKYKKEPDLSFNNKSEQQQNRVYQ